MLWLAELQEVTLTGMHWGTIAAAMQSLAALPQLCKLTLVDNDMQHLHQVKTACAAMLLHTWHTA